MDYLATLLVSGLVIRSSEKEIYLISSQHSHKWQHKVALGIEEACSEWFKLWIAFLSKLRPENGYCFRKHSFCTIDCLQCNPGSHVRQIHLEWKGVLGSDAKSDANCVRPRQTRRPRKWKDIGTNWLFITTLLISKWKEKWNLNKLSIRSTVNALLELCSPFLKGSNSAFIAAMASGLFPKKRILVTQITMTRMVQIERKEDLIIKA